MSGELGTRRELTARQRQVIEMLADPDATIASIAARLELGEQYVRNLTLSIYRTLGVHSRHQAVRAWRATSEPV